MSKAQEIVEYENHKLTQKYDEKARIVVGALAFAACAFVAGMAIGLELTTHTLRQQAIERGYAIHDPVTGDWRWLEDSEVAKRPSN